MNGHKLYVYPEFSDEDEMRHGGGHDVLGPRFVRLVRTERDNVLGANIVKHKHSIS